MAKKIMSLVEGTKQISLEEMVEIDQGIDNDTIKINELNRVIEQREDIITESSSIAGALSEISEHVNEAGTLAEHEAKTIDIAVEHFCKRLGYKSKVYVSLERHNNCTGNTVVALEGIVSSIWDAIKAAFRRMKEWIRAAWEAIFGKSEKIEKKEVVVQSQRKEVDNKVPALTQDKITEAINRQNEKAAIQKAANEAIAIQRVSVFFRKEDGSGCFSAKEIEDKTAKLLGKVSSGEFTKDIEEIGVTNRNQLASLDSFFDQIDKVSERINANDKEGYNKELELFEKSALKLKDNTASDGEIIMQQPFDYNLVTSRKGAAILTLTKRYFKQLYTDEVVELPTKQFKEKILASVSKLRELEGNGKNKASIKSGDILLDHIDKRINKSSKLYNEAIEKMTKGTAHDLGAHLFGMMIVTETSSLRLAVKIGLDLQRSFVEYFVEVMNNLLEYVKLSDQFILDEYGQTTTII